MNIVALLIMSTTIYVYARECARDEKLLNANIENKLNNNVKVVEKFFNIKELPLLVKGTKFTSKYYSAICNGEWIRGVNEACYGRYYSAPFNKGTLKEMKTMKECYIGRECKGRECIGDDAKGCGAGIKRSSVKIKQREMIVPEHRHHQWFRDTCWIIWDCNIEDDTITPNWMDDSQIMFETIGLDKVILKVHEEEFIGYEFSFLLEPYSVKKFDKIKLKCLKAESTVCYDHFVGKSFNLESNHGVSQNRLYIVDDTNDEINYSMNIGVYTNAIDFNTLNDNLMYHNLQLVYDAQLLKTKLIELEKLVKSMLLYQLNYTNNPLSELIGTDLTTKGYTDNGYIVISPCNGKTVDTIHKVTTNSSYTLFPSLNLSLDEMKAILVDLNSHLVSTIKSMQEHIWKQGSGSVKNEGDHEYWDFQFWDWLCYKWNSFMGTIVFIHTCILYFVVRGRLVK